MLPVGGRRVRQPEPGAGAQRQLRQERQREVLLLLLLLLTLAPLLLLTLLLLTLQSLQVLTLPAPPFSMIISPNVALYNLTHWAAKPGPVIWCIPHGLCDPTHTPCAKSMAPASAFFH